MVFRRNLEGWDGRVKRIWTFVKIKMVILLRFPLPDIPVNIVWGRRKHFKANCSCETLLSLFVTLPKKT